MVPYKYICMFASIALVQADLNNYNSLIHHEKPRDDLSKKLIEPVSNNVDGLRGNERSNINDELHLYGDDRIPLDYDLNEKSSEYKVKEMNHGLQTGLTNIALAVVKDVLFNQANIQYDYKECIGAMANIIEEEHLVAKIRNLTVDAMKIVTNATQIILQCQEKNSFSTCLTTAVNVVGPAFIAVTEDIEHVFYVMLVVGEKLLEQVRLCIGRNDLPLADIVYSMLHFVQFNEKTRPKKEEKVPEEIPKIVPRDEEMVVAKKNPIFNKDNWFNNLDLI